MTVGVPPSMPYEAEPSRTRGGRRGSVGTSNVDGAPTATKMSVAWRDRPRWLRWLVASMLLVLASAAVASPWWGPKALSTMDYFHVRTIEFEGLTFTKPTELVRLMQVDTTESIWQPLDTVMTNVAAHPMVLRAVIERDLPGTLRVLVTERVPVAMVPSRRGLRPADASGHVLPIDPAAVPLDLPIAASADSTLLSVLGAMRLDAPALYARVADARRVAKDELRFTLTGSTVGAAGPAMIPSLIVRTGDDVTVARFKDILPVEADLARNHLRAVELDLRFRDQVIARQP